MTGSKAAVDDCGKWRGLLVAMIARAALDARQGDDAARAWLAGPGAELLDALGLAVDIGGWLADLPDKTRPLALEL